MEIRDMSITFHTAVPRECADFYVRWVGAEVTFDCDWYISVRMPGSGHELSFQHAGVTGRKQADGAATINLRVDDVDARYEDMKAAGVVFEEHIADHDYGDRAFSFLDPIGNVVYVYSDRPVGERYRVAVK